jgi:heme/copper-type cytochrome/quinol oxidase subunit 4
MLTFCLIVAFILSVNITLCPFSFGLIWPPLYDKVVWLIVGFILSVNITLCPFSVGLTKPPL